MQHRKFDKVSKAGHPLLPCGKCHAMIDGMKPFKAEVPSFPTETTKPFRDDTQDAIKALKGPTDDDDIKAEMIAIAFVHEDPAIRNAAMKWVKKHVDDAKDFKAAYKTMANVDPFYVEERIRAFEHSLRTKIALAMVFHRRHAVAFAFEEDARIQRAILRVMAERTQREDEPRLRLDEVYWSWHNNSGQTTYRGNSTFLCLRSFSNELVDEINSIRNDFSFTGLRASLALFCSLPTSFDKFEPWLTSLELDGEFETFPKVLSKLTNLEDLSLIGTPMHNVSESILTLTKLKRLRIDASEMKSIPLSICQMSWLEHLHIEGDRIRTIPEEISQMSSLQELDMSETKVRKVPSSLAQLGNLKKVVLNSDHFDEETAQKAFNPETTIEIV